MGLHFRKTKKLGPFRITASKSGVGISAGVAGARITKRADGRTQATVGLPGTGIRYTATTGSTGRRKASGAQSQSTVSDNGVHHGGSGNQKFALLFFSGGTLLISQNTIELRHYGSAVKRGGVSRLSVNVKDISHIHVVGPNGPGTIHTGEFTLVTHAMAKGGVTPVTHHQMTMSYNNTAGELARIESLRQAVRKWNGPGRIIRKLLS